jgi:hypothetical protein
MCLAVVSSASGLSIGSLTRGEQPHVADGE